MGNFIKVDRKMLDWEWWQDINTSRLFLFMLLSAYWKDGRYKGTVIPRGSFPSTTVALAKGTSLTENEIRTALKHLKSTNEITNRNHGKYTVFTVVKYNEYQGFNEQECKQNANKMQSINGQITNTLLKEDKKEKKGKNNILYAAVVDYLNEKAGTKFKPGSKSTQRFINGRVDDGFSLEDFKKVIDTMCDKWKHDEKMCQYLRPQTLFGTKFESYLNMAPKNKPPIQAAKKPQEEEDEEQEVDDEEWKRNFDKEGANK